MGRGATIFIGRTHQCMCPVAAVEAYMGCCSCSATLHHSSTTGMGCPSQPMFYPSTFLHLIMQCGFDAAKFNTHSLRIGAASTAARAGLSSDTIQKLVRWRSSAYETYTHHPLTHPSDTRTMAAAQYLIPTCMHPCLTDVMYSHKPVQISNHFWGCHLGSTCWDYTLGQPQNHDQHLGLGHRPIQWWPVSPLGPCRLSGTRYSCYMPDCGSRLPHDGQTQPQASACR